MMKQKMIQKLYSILLLTAIICGYSGTISCSDERLPEMQEWSIQGDEIICAGSLSIPGMTEAATRGDAGDMAGSGLLLTVVEFDLGRTPTSSFLTNIYNATIVGVTNVSNMTEVEFKFKIKASTTSKVLHFLLTEKPIYVGSGSIASIFPSLVSCREGGEAYWGYREFPDGLAKPGTTENDSPVVNDGVINALKKIPMIRNFAKISVEVDIPEGSEDGFNLIGFDLVNIPQNGTVAPWDEGNLAVPNLLKEGLNEMLSYEALTYKGYTPSFIYFDNTETEAKDWDNPDNPNPNLIGEGNTASRFVYEHPYDADNRTYLIIYGQFIKNGTPEQASYYKIDLGYVDEVNSNVFRHYNIIRNYHYNVKITKVTGSGMETIAKAIAHPPYNNISASTETSEMLQISNNKNLLVVDNNRFIITKPDQKIEVIYRYFKDIDKSEAEGGKTPDNGCITTVDLKPGEVIKATDPLYTTEIITNEKGEEQYGKLTIWCNNPTSITKRQSFSIVAPDGLGRTINLILRNPWQYAYLRDEKGKPTTIKAAIAPGTSNTYPFGEDGTYPEQQVISCKAKEPITVYFDLPPEMDESVFPLEFQLEALNQGIENNKVGNLVVMTGPSLFDPDEITISYVKKVTLEEYRYMYDDDNKLNNQIPNANHTVRCRFLTINEVESGGEGEIRIHNKYFDNDISVKFTRVNLENSDTENP